MTARTRPALTLAALITVAAMLGAVAASGLAGTRPGVEWWRPVRIHSIRADNYTSLDALTLGADAVVMGRVQRVQMGRSFLADPELGDDGYAYFAEVTVAIDDVIRNSSPIDLSATARIEIFLPRETALDLLVNRLPDDPQLLFLRHKGSEAAMLGLDEAVIQAEAPYFRLVVREAVIADRLGLADAFDDAEDGYLRALDGVVFSEVLKRVRDVAALAN